MKFTRDSTLIAPSTVNLMPFDSKNIMLCYVSPYASALWTMRVDRLILYNNGLIDRLIDLLSCTWITRDALIRAPRYHAVWSIDCMLRHWVRLIDLKSIGVTCIVKSATAPSERFTWRAPLTQCTNARQGRGVRGRGSIKPTTRLNNWWYQSTTRD